MGRRAAARAHRGFAGGPPGARPPRGSRPAAARSATPARRRAARRVAGSARAAAAARVPSTKHSLRLLEASRLAPCRPVQAHSPTANSPGSDRAPVEVGRDPAHHVVGGGGDRHRALRRGRSRPAERLEHVREALAGDPAQVEQDVVGAVRVHAVQDRQRDRVARRQLVGEALAGGVEQRRPLAANRLGHQQPVRVGARRGERGGVELAELEVGQRRRRRRSPSPTRRRSRPRGWWCGPTAPRRRRWRAPSRGRATAPGVGDHAVAALAVAPQGQRRGALGDVDARVGGRQRREPLGDPLPVPGAARVDDPPAGVAALQGQLEPAVGVAVELDPAALELLQTAGRLGGEHLGGRAPAGTRARRRRCPRRAARASRRRRSRPPGRPGPSSSSSR